MQVKKCIMDSSCSSVQLYIRLSLSMFVLVSMFVHEINLEGSFLWPWHSLLVLSQNALLSPGFKHYFLSSNLTGSVPAFVFVFLPTHLLSHVKMSFLFLQAAFQTQNIANRRCFTCCKSKNIFTVRFCIFTHVQIKHYVFFMSVHMFVRMFVLFNLRTDLDQI